MELTAEQLAVIEKNRLKAVAIRQSKLKETQLIEEKRLAALEKLKRSKSGHPTTEPVATKQFRPGPLFDGKVNVPLGNKVNLAAYENLKRSKSGQQEAAKKLFHPSPVVDCKLKVSLANKGRVFFDFACCPIVTTAVKSIKSAQYDQYRWSVDLEDCFNTILAIKKLATDKVKVEFEDTVPAPLIAKLVKYRLSIPSVPPNLSERLSRQMIERLFAFQKVGIQFGVSRHGRCLIADEMGLGKTVQALGIAAWFKDDWPLVIVCPASVTAVWKNAVLDWLSELAEDQVEIQSDGKGRTSCKLVTIMSYDRLVKVADEIISRRTNFVIFDESHSIKNEDAQRTQAAAKVGKVAKRVVLLSGTPALSRPMELYTQLNIVDPNLFEMKNAFGKRYCDGKLVNYGNRQAWDYNGHSHEQELGIALHSTIMIRRLKTDVLKELPSKDRRMRVVDLKLGKEQATIMNAYSKTMEKKRDKSALLEWYHETATLKIPMLLEIVGRYIDQGKKFICFAHHKDVIEALSEMLQEKDCCHIRIDGSTPPSLRQECCDYFQKEPDCKVAVVSIIAAGVGITLTSASFVVFAELYWNPGILTQAEDRAHRIGQTETVVVEYIIARKTVDDWIWAAVSKKLEVLGKIDLTKDSMKETSILPANQKTIEDFFEKSC